jgi:hypothetical protein
MQSCMYTFWKCTVILLLREKLVQYILNLIETKTRSKKHTTDTLALTIMLSLNIVLVQTNHLIGIVCSMFRILSPILIYRFTLQIKLPLSN